MGLLNFEGFLISIKDAKYHTVKDVYILNSVNER
jgi:hypothetical protein